MHTQDGKNLSKPIKTSPTPPNTTTHCMLPMHALNAKHLQTPHEHLKNRNNASRHHHTVPMRTQDGKNLRKPIKTSPTPPNTTTHCMLPMHALNAKHLQTQHEHLKNRNNASRHHHTVPMHTQDGKNLRKPIKTSPTPPNTTTH